MALVWCGSSRPSRLVLHPPCQFVEDEEGPAREIGGGEQSRCNGMSITICLLARNCRAGDEWHRGCCILSPSANKRKCLQKWGSMSGCEASTGSSVSDRGGPSSRGLRWCVVGWLNHGLAWVRLPVKAALRLWSELSTVAPTGVATLLEASICNSHLPSQHARGETPDLVSKSDDGGATGVVVPLEGIVLGDGLGHGPVARGAMRQWRTARAFSMCDVRWMSCFVFARGFSVAHVLLSWHVVPPWRR